jgi:hypothetical protein
MHPDLLEFSVSRILDFFLVKRHRVTVPAVARRRFGHRLAVSDHPDFGGREIHRVWMIRGAVDVE